MTSEFTRHNPYATPVSAPAAPVVAEPPFRDLRLRRLIAIQSVVIVGSLVLEFFKHESIVGSGPVFAVLGITIAIVAYRHRDRSAMYFGCSAFMFASLIVFLINYYSWSPAQGDRPITILSFVYAGLALPVSVWLLLSSKVSNSGG